MNNVYIFYCIYLELNLLQASILVLWLERNQRHGYTTLRTFILPFNFPNVLQNVLQQIKLQL